MGGVVCLGNFEVVVSTRKTVSVGSGTTRRKHESVAYFLACNVDSVLTVQPLNTSYLPEGVVEEVSLDRFLSDFTPEPLLYYQKTKPVLIELNGILDSGEENLAKGSYGKAEQDFQRALGMDVNNLRATFGLGRTYLRSGAKEKGVEIFNALIKLDFSSPGHKHLFNEFGILMRKAGLYVQSLRYYARALRRCRNDENLYFNYSRVLFEMGKLLPSERMLKRALVLNPASAECRALAGHIAKKRRPGPVRPT